MCGIAAVFSRSPVAPTVRRLSEGVAHRGPDDSGDVALVDGDGRPAGHLAHRRLAVLDITAMGHQPMMGASGRLVVAYNGEIYNFRELREGLRSRGCSFRSDSDTEVLLSGWAVDGPPFLERLRGMFAFVLWDTAASCAYVARDRFGMKPLYLAEGPGFVAVASEVGALLRSGVVERRFSALAVATYLASGSVAEPFTAIEGIEALRAGTWADIRFGADGPKVGTARSFATIPVRPETPSAERTPEAAGGRIRVALRETVAAHLVSDVEVGLFLSGGIDSAVLLALTVDVSNRPLRTFTVGFVDEAGGESEAASAIARRFGAVHSDVRISGVDLLGALPDAFRSMDQPSMDGLNVFVVSRAVHAGGIKVALSGLGGDELFGGYPSFGRARRSATLWRTGHPSRWRRAAAALAHLGKGVRAEKAALWFGAPTAAAGAYRGSRALFGPQGAQALGAGPALLPEPAPEGLSLGGEVSWYELTGYMRNTLLRDADVFSMAHGLELRTPFVDADLAAAVASVDEAIAYAGPGSKPLLRLAAEDLLPSDVWGRPKRGFTLPFASWLRGPLRLEVEAELTGEGVERCGLARGQVRSVWTAFLRGTTTWSRPWALYTLCRWARERGIGPPALVTH